MASTCTNPAVGGGWARQEFGSEGQNKPAENNRPITATQQRPTDDRDDCWQSVGEAAARVLHRLAGMLAERRDIIEVEAAE